MKYLIIPLLFLLISCNENKFPLNYPKNESEIDKILVTKHRYDQTVIDSTTFKLTRIEITKLLNELEKAKPVGLVKMAPKFRLNFLTIDGKVITLRGNKNIIKSSNNDIGYEIHNIEFLNKYLKN